MAAALPTLIQLLRDLHEELRTCLERENPPPIKEPILLGDFIVDAYNAYLRQAKAVCDDTLVQALPEVRPSAPAESQPQTPEMRARLDKMTEVAFSAKRLLALLEGVVAAPAAAEPPELAAALGLLDSLKHFLSHGEAVRNTGLLIDQYNRAVGMLHEALHDAVLSEVFAPLAHAPAEAGPEVLHGKLMEVWMAHTAVRSYLQRRGETGSPRRPADAGPSAPPSRGSAD